MLKTLCARLALALLTLPALFGCVSTADAEARRYEEVFEVVALDFAQAHAIARILEPLVAEQTAEGRWKPVQVAVDARSNSILLHGQRARVDEIAEAVAELDREMD